ncbi:MAG TPA: Gfo/Idh/MocA family oxidoreductase [Ktedonobacteraceae bacterium]
MESTDSETKMLSRRRALALLAMTPALSLGLASSSVSIPDIERVGRLRLALLSFWHVHAPEYAHQALANNATTITAIWDEQEERGQAQARAYGVPFYSSLQDLLAHSDSDGVIVDAPTIMHHDVMIAAARAGKHIFTEKVLAPTLREALEIVAAVKQANVVLMVSLPRLYDGTTLAIKAIFERNLLGEVTQLRTRLSHDGALPSLLYPHGWLPASFFDPQQTGGGAMIDIGAHPMYMARYLLGLPESVNATYSALTGHAVEDNAVALLRYQRGAIGVVEAGFVTPFSPFTIEANGTEGSLMFGTPDNKIWVCSTHMGRSSGAVWSAWTAVSSDQPTPFQQWVTHIQQGTTAQENVQIAIDLSLLVEAANRSARDNQPVLLDSITRS